MSQWQLLTIRVHYLHADGTVGEHVSTADTQQTQAVSTAMAQLVFSPAVWAVEFSADGTTITLVAVDRDGSSGGFLVRAAVAGVERSLACSRRRGLELTADLPIGQFLFTADHLFAASPQIFHTVCSSLSSGFDAALPDGWRWSVGTPVTPLVPEPEDERLRAG